MKADCNLYKKDVNRCLVIPGSERGCCDLLDVTEGTVRLLNPYNGLMTGWCSLITKPVLD